MTNSDKSKTPFDLSGRRALITGGTQGVGASIARALAEAGADVLLVGLAEDELAKKTLRDCRDSGVEAAFVQTDLSQPPSNYLPSLLQAADQLLPNIDLLINNAGTYIDTPFFEMDVLASSLSPRHGRSTVR